MDIAAEKVKGVDPACADLPDICIGGLISDMRNMSLIRTITDEQEKEIYNDGK